MEKNKRATIHVRVEKETDDVLTALAEKFDAPKSELIRQAIKAWTAQKLKEIKR